MGLDLECDGKIMRMGSYSSVHVQRAGLMMATIHRATATGDPRGASLLQSVLSPENEIDYKILRSIRPFFENDEDNDHMKGLYLFVYHSDCEGAWSPEDAGTILAWFQDLHPWLPRVKILSPYIDPSSGEYHLESLFARSVASDSPIVLM